MHHPAQGADGAAAAPIPHEQDIADTEPLTVQVVEFLKRPERFTAVGARIPKGVLLVGPPGTAIPFLPSSPPCFWTAP